MQLKNFLFAFLALISISVQAQIIIGYNGGYATCHELNREIYIYDQINKSGLKKEMKPIHWNQGPEIGFRVGKEVYFELVYSRKRAKVGADFDSSGVPMSRQLKVLSNTYNFGFGYVKDGWGIGCSMDAGRFKGFGRRGPESDIGKQDWKRLWVIDKTRLAGIAIYRLYVTETFWVEHSMGRFNIRLYVQPWGMRSKLDGLDNWLFGTQLNYGENQKEHFCNFGLAMYFNLGKN